MNKLIYSSTQVLLLALVFFTINGCKKSTTNDQPQTEKGAYSALVCVGSWPNTAYYIADLPSLTTGTLSIQGNGASLNGKVYAQDVIQKNGFYYHANFGTGRIGKYHVDKGNLVVDKEVSFTYLNWSSYTWVDENTLVIFGSGSVAKDAPEEARYAIIKVADMSITTGKLAINGLPTGFTRYTFGFAEYRNGKIFVGYGFGADWSNYPNMPSYDKSYVAVASYPAMSIEKSIEETRSAGMGGDQVYASSSFVDENGDIYFISDPVNRLDYTKPSLVYRIKNGSTELDPSYNFNFSATVNNGMGAAMWYIGDGKAIVRTRVAGQNIDADHSFSVIDVRNGKFIKKLDLPADKGERMVNAVIYEDGKAFIAVNAADRDFIWQYDPKTDVLTKGLEFIGGIDYILRIEKTK